MKIRKRDLEKSFPSSQVLRVIIQRAQEAQKFPWEESRHRQLGDKCSSWEKREAPETIDQWSAAFTASKETKPHVNVYERNSMFSRVLPTCIVGGGTFSHEAQSFTRLPCFWPPALDKRARTQHHILNYGITWWMCLYLKIFQGSRSPSFKWWKDGLNICPLVHSLVHNTWQHRGDSNINKVYVVIGFIVVLDDYGQVSCEVMTHRDFLVVFSGEWGRWKLQLAMSPWQAKAQAGWWDNQISPPPTSPLRLS